MQGFKAVAIMLMYPEPWWLDETEHLHAALSRCHARAARLLAPLLEELGTADRLWLQERYVDTFDRVPDHALYLLQHRPEVSRGDAISALVDRYRSHGLELTGNELPDYLPLFLEYLSLLPPAEARRELAPYRGVIATLRERLAGRSSAYAALFDAIALLAGTPLVTMGSLWQRSP
ncbi:MAG: nitrate reductase molybdenum cofactor assembly chaperone [Thiohalomonadaceae bacterium]